MGIDGLAASRVISVDSVSQFTISLGEVGHSGGVHTVRICEYTRIRICWHPEGVMG